MACFHEVLDYVGGDRWKCIDCRKIFHIRTPVKRKAQEELK